MKRIGLPICVLATLVVAGGIGYWIAQRSLPVALKPGVANPSRGQVLYWYDPMVPQQHFDRPGLSPMGMQMVPKYADAGIANDVVRIDPATQQNLGLRSTRVKVGRLTGSVHVPGTIAWDQRLAVTISARTDAAIAELHVRAPYTQVRSGQPLAELLAPQWSAAAAEYLALRDAQSADALALRDAARARLQALGMNAATIRDLRPGANLIVLRAPIDGVVSELDVRDGQQVTAGAPIMSLNGLDRVWIDAAIPQADSSGIHAGSPIVATVTAMPDATFHGQIEAMLPSIDSATRSQHARIVLDTPQHRLAPGMFADIRIETAAGAPHPLVPDEALIATGIDTRVIEILSNGSFKPVRVRTGRSSGGTTEVLAGLDGGERVVTSGQFLIDSEASLSGALERLDGGTDAELPEKIAAPDGDGGDHP